MDTENLICKCPLCIAFYTTKYYCIENIKYIHKITSKKSKYEIK
jgi:hypothetical protein